MPLDSVLDRKYFVMNRNTIQKKFYPVVKLRSKLDSSTEIKKSFEFFAETFLALPCQDRRRQLAEHAFAILNFAISRKKLSIKE